jgi:23S rRNA pseudouridine1911/1915/1917 synthase
VKTLKLEVAEDEVRLDVALLAELQKVAPYVSRASLKPWFKAGHVLLNERPAPASHLLRRGTHEVRLLRWSDSLAHGPRAQASQEGAFLPVVYEDDDLLVLHKLTGIPSVPQDGEEGRTAVGAALAYLPSLQSIGRGGFEPAILHRLDTGTSGLLVFAKTSAEFDRLRALWRDGHVNKTYRALTRTTAALPSLPLQIDYPLGHDAKSARRMVALLPGRAREIRGEPIPALTHLRRVREINPGYYDLEVEIVTGVMHQIRCHLAALGLPLLGDEIYRGVPSSRLWLHAWRLAIPLHGGQTLTLEAALPPQWPKPRN